MYVNASTVNPLGQKPWGFQLQHANNPSLQGLACDCPKTALARSLGDDTTDASFDPSSLFSNPLMLIGLGALAFFAFAAGNKTSSGIKRTYRRTRRAVQAF